MFTRGSRQIRKNLEQQLADAAEKTPATLNLKRRLQLYVGKRPTLFYRFYPVRSQPGTCAVTPTTQLVIEGYPRCANTFAVHAFDQAQGRESVRVAHHMHMPAQVVRAARWQIPALVLLRKPEDAVRSFVVRNPRSVDWALKHYVMFYETVAEYRDAYVLGRFEEVTSDYGEVIRRINARFGTEFYPFEHDEANVKQVFARVEEVEKLRYKGTIDESMIPRPSPVRRGMKGGVEYHSEDQSRRALIVRAEAAYESLVRGG